MSTMVERAEIPEHFWDAARSLRSAVLWESNSSVEHIAQALLAAEKRGKEEERERWKPAAVYFDRYCQDEAAELECCLSEQQHTDAKAFAAAIRGS